MRGRVASSKTSYNNTLEKIKIADKAVKSIAKYGEDDIIKISAKPGSAKYRELKKKEIIKKGISQKTPVFSDDAFGVFASRIPAKQGFYDVAIHGSPKTTMFYGERISANTLAEIIK